MRFSPSPASPPLQEREARGVSDVQAPAAVNGRAAGPRVTPPEPAAAVARQPRRVRVEHLAWAAVVIVAALLRLPALAASPLSLSDSSRAFAAWQVAAGRLPTSWNGDLAQTFAALLFKLAGAGDGVARLPAAVAGVGLVGACWLYRRHIGRGPALIAAVVICLSPACVALSRSLSPYAAGALFSLIASALLLSFLQEPRPATVLWLSGLLALGLSTDASFLVFVLAATFFCLIEGFWKRCPELLSAARFLRSDAPLIRSAALIGVAGLLLSTTRFGIASERLRSAAATSWSDAFALPTGGAPWHFPIDALLGYEPVLALGGFAATALLIRRLRSGNGNAAERLLVYWTIGALLFVLVASNRNAGQLPALLIPLALISAICCSRWLTTAQASLLRSALLPLLLAFPAMVYVLFVVESATTQSTLTFGQAWALAFLFAGGAGLIVLGAVWTRESLPAYAVICALIVGTVFGLHTLARVSLGNGDEFLLGPVATPNAVALGEEIAGLTPSLKGAVSLSPQLAAPLAWYTREAASVRIQQPSRASAAAVLSVDQAAPSGFQALVPSTEIARAWYPTAFDFGGVLRWLLYRRRGNPYRPARLSSWCSVNRLELDSGFGSVAMTSTPRPSAGSFGTPRWLERLLALEITLDGELAAYLAIVGLSFALHFWNLGARALHHDESLHATYSWYLYKGAGYKHDPLMHGPVLFHLTALMYFLFGVSDVGSSRVDLQACKLEYSIVSPK